MGGAGLSSAPAPQPPLQPHGRSVRPLLPRPHAPMVPTPLGRSRCLSPFASDLIHPEMERSGERLGLHAWKQSAAPLPHAGCRGCRRGSAPPHRTPPIPALPASRPPFHPPPHFIALFMALSAINSPFGDGSGQGQPCSTDTQRSNSQPYGLALRRKKDLIKKGNEDGVVKSFNYIYLIMVNIRRGTLCFSDFTLKLRAGGYKQH